MAKRTTDERIAAEEAKLEAAKERVKSLKRKKAAQSRKDDTRRKVLYGAIVLERMSQNAEFKAFMNTLMDKAVTRDIDREFLGLKKKPEEPKKAAPPSARKAAGRAAKGESGGLKFPGFRS